MAGKIGEMLVEIRAGTATLSTDIERAKREFGKVPPTAESAQKRIVEILERGEPGKALRRKATEELATLREMNRQKLITIEQFEAARTKLLTDYAARRAALNRRGGAANDDLAPPLSRGGSAQAGAQGGDIYAQLTWAGERMEGVRSVMAALGMQTHSVMDGMTLFTSAMVKGAGKATIFGFALAGVGAVANALVEHFAEMRRVEAQMDALSATFGTTARDVRMVGNAFADFTGELDRSTVQAIMKAGLEAGLTASEIAGMGAEVKRLMDIDGSSAVDAAGKAAQEAAKAKADDVLRRARAANDAKEQELFGPTMAEQLLRRADELEREAVRISNEIRMAERNAVYLVSNEERERAEDAIRVLRGERQRLRADAERLREESGRTEMLEGADKARKEDEADAAKAKADRERRAREAEQERKRELDREKREREERQKEAERTVQAAKDLLHERDVLDSAENERIGRVRLERERELLALEDLYAAKIELGQADLAWEEEYLRQRAEINDRATREIAAIRADDAKKLSDAHAKAQREALRQARIDEQAAEQGAIAGIRFGESFLLSFKRVIDGKGDAGDWLSTILQVGGSFASLFPGGQVLGAGMASLGSLVGAFAEGGLITGIGGPRDDRNLALVSPGEFIVNAAATRKARPLLEAINSGRIGPSIPAFANGGYVGKGAAAGMVGGVYAPTVNVAAFDPRSMLEVIGHAVEPAQYRRGAARQDGKQIAGLRRRVAEPRTGRPA